MLWPRIILASASPRRAELLKQIGVPFTQIMVDIDESVLASETGSDYVLRLAQEKARVGAELAQQQGIRLAVLAADTSIELDADILGKPVDSAQACAMLEKLSGRSHHVHTAVSLLAQGIQRSALSSSLVEFAVLSRAQIEAYVDSGEPLDKAGGYAIQGAAAQFIKQLQGSYSGVMGLPLYETATLLRTIETQPSS